MSPVGLVRVKWAGDERARLGMLKGKAGLGRTRKEGPGQRKPRPEKQQAERV